MRKYFKSGGSLTKTSLSAGRIAGCGVLYDDYSDESGNRPIPLDKRTALVRLPHDGTNPEALNGPVIIVQKGKEKAAAGGQDR